MARWRINRLNDIGYYGWTSYLPGLSLHLTAAGASVHAWLWKTLDLNLILRWSRSWSIQAQFIHLGSLWFLNCFENLCTFNRTTIHLLVEDPAYTCIAITWLQIFNQQVCATPLVSIAGVVYHHWLTTVLSPWARLWCLLN